MIFLSKKKGGIGIHFLEGRSDLGSPNFVRLGCFDLKFGLVLGEVTFKNRGHKLRFQGYHKNTPKKYWALVAKIPEIRRHFGVDKTMFPGFLVFTPQMPRGGRGKG